MFEEIKTYLPLLVPLIILQFALLAYTLLHILNHDTYKRGTRVLWIVIVLCVNFIGPILYLILGKEEE